MVFTVKDTTTFTESEMLSLGRNPRHWVHWNVLKRQPLVQEVTIFFLFLCLSTTRMINITRAQTNITDNAYVY